MKNEYYSSPRPSRLMKIFWKACGADKYILERSTYADQVKYASLGGIVVATGLMAAMAGGYAFYTIFAPKGGALESMLTRDMVKQGVNAPDLTHWPTVFIALVFGIIWGLIIFNIDKFIVTSTGKGDGTEAITWKEFTGAIPRILMGMIIALTISKPVEIRMFKSEIDAALKIKQTEHADSLYNKSVSKIQRDIEIEEKRQAKWEDEIAVKEKRYSELENTYNDETTGALGPRGVGPEARAIKAQMDRLDNTLIGLRKKNSNLIETSMAKVSKLEELKEIKRLEAENDAKALDGLLERIKIAHEIAGTTISLFITLLFMTIELTPIFFKMMLIKSPYDYIDENVKELVKASNGIEVKYNFYEDGEGIERHLVVNHAVDKELKEKVQMIEAQSELNQKIIEEWKNEQMKEIKENPSKFIEKNS